MLSYLETLERLTKLRDGLRETLDTESGDRQATVELTEMTLTKLLGELVTPGIPAPQTITIDLAVILSDPSETCPSCGKCKGDCPATVLDPQHGCNCN
jgi:hypothetical protein